MEILAINFTVTECILHWRPSIGNGDGENEYEAKVKVRVREKVEHRVGEGDTPLDAFFSALREALCRLFPSIEEVCVASQALILEYGEFKAEIDLSERVGVVCEHASSRDLNRALLQAIVRGFDAAVSRSLSGGLSPHADRGADSLLMSRRRMVSVRVEARMPNQPS